MIASYKDLEVYKEAYRMFLKIHQMTQRYPDVERYEIGAQIRRAAMSIPLNIADRIKELKFLEKSHQN